MSGNSEDKKYCMNCIHVDIFKPRKDEIEKGHLLGCKKDGWEGYTTNEKPACSGIFFIKKEAILK